MLRKFDCDLCGTPFGLGGGEGVLFFPNPSDAPGYRDVLQLCTECFCELEFEEAETETPP